MFKLIGLTFNYNLEVLLHDIAYLLIKIVSAIIHVQVVASSIPTIGYTIQGFIVHTT